ncbi:MAG: hypothetical protein ACP5PW_02895, partial [Candidatus Dormibacteria bacterium]
GELGGLLWTGGAWLRAAAPESGSLTFAIGSRLQSRLPGAGLGLCAPRNPATTSDLGQTELQKGNGA